MQANLSSRIRTRRSADLSPVPALSNASIYAQSEGSEWRGIHVELGSNPDFVVDDIIYDGHLVGFNPTRDTFHFELRHESGWYPACLPRGGFFVMPHGQPVSVRRRGNWSWGIVIVDSGYLDAVFGARYDLATECGFSDEMLRRLFFTLLDRIDVQEHEQTGLTATLVRAFTLALGQRHGHRHAEPPGMGKLTAAQLSDLQLWTEARLHTGFTVEQMAAHVGLSSSHFARLFRQACGMTPWAYVVKLRLERAARLLGEGEAVSDVAVGCGFSDQAHLSRRFKQHYGTSPSAFALRERASVELH